MEDKKNEFLKIIIASVSIFIIALAFFYGCKYMSKIAEEELKLPINRAIDFNQM